MPVSECTFTDEAHSAKQHIGFKYRELQDVVHPFYLLPLLLLFLLLCLCVTHS
jgi:hypothetical protein